ncbi:metallophosphoesterase family protein [Reichenbachiella sp.]|uniref:metallophosphoesterase family protein n=1 Tax=Reichenbachiella sp. TaxID=2184521 RepID=UPI003BB0C1B6
MKIALVTDLHAEESWVSDEGVSSWENWKVILNDILSKDINQMIFLGDIGAPSAHQQFLDSLNQSGLDYKVILGNHENFDEVIKTKRPAAIAERKEWYWSEENNGFKSIYLDTSTDAISRTQLDWLEAELQTDQTTLLFVHHPILLTNTTPHLEFPLKGDEQVLDLLQSRSQPIHIFCGHLHLDDHQTTGHIQQTITPSASIQIKRHSEKAEVENIGFAYRVLEFKENQITSEVVWL